MQLLEALATGYPDAASGWVEVKRRGTSQDATVYSDPEGLNALSATQHILDADGAKKLFVAEQVDVYVYDADGVLVRDGHTVSNWAAGMEYSGQSFTGTDPVTGVTGAQKPLNIQALFNLWLTSAGALDWKVQKDVASTPATWNLKSLGVSVGTAFINVKDPVYGAKGDGTNDDVTAIQNAINAAEAAGGGVVLVPPGTYNTSDALVIDSPGVTMWFLGGAKIEVTSTTVNGFTITANRTALINPHIKVKDSVGANNAAYGISASGADDLSIVAPLVGDVDVATYNFARGIYATECARLRISDGARVEGTAYGIYVHSATNAQHPLTTNTPAAMIPGGTADMQIEKAWYAVITGCMMDAATVKFVGARYVTFTGNGIGGGTLDIDADTIFFNEAGNFFDRGNMTLTYATSISSLSNRFTSTARKAPSVTASTAALALPNPGAHTLYEISGTADITSIVVDGWPEARITLKFTGNAAATGLTDGSNLKLAGNFAYTADDTIELEFDGSDWLEVSRSAN